MIEYILENFSEYVQEMKINNRMTKILMLFDGPPAEVAKIFAKYEALFEYDDSLARFAMYIDVKSFAEIFAYVLENKGKKSFKTVLKDMIRYDKEKGLRFDVFLRNCYDTRYTDTES